MPLKKEVVVRAAVVISKPKPVKLLSGTISYTPMNEKLLNKFAAATDKTNKVAFPGYA